MFKSVKKQLGQYKRNFKIKQHHKKNALNLIKTSKKQIIICFDGVVPHGGLVDRLKGIISLFDVAQQLNYDFYIQFNHPFKLDVFLEPNIYNWTISDDSVGFNSKNSELLNLVNNFDVNPLQQIKNSKASNILVYANIDYLNILNPEKSEIEIESLWRHHFNTLFKKTDYLENALKIQAASFVSVHTRFTSIMGDFVDSTTQTISAEEKETIISTLEKGLNTIKNQYKSVYIFSDSILFLKEITKRCDVKTLKGQPFHMDSYKGNADLEAHLKTMQDFFTIAKSEKVFFLKTGKMYNSAFSKYAAIIGNVPFKKIDL